MANNKSESKIYEKADQLPMLRSIEASKVKLFLDRRSNYWNTRKEQDEATLKKLKPKLNFTNLIEQGLLKQLKDDELEDYTGFLSLPERENYNYEDALENYLNDLVETLKDVVDPLQNLKEWEASLQKLSCDCSQSVKFKQNLVNLKRRMAECTEEFRSVNHAVQHEKGRESYLKHFLAAIEPAEVRNHVTGRLEIMKESEWSANIKERMNNVYLRLPERLSKIEEFEAMEEDNEDLVIIKNRVHGLRKRMESTNTSSSAENKRKKARAELDALQITDDWKRFVSWAQERQERWLRIDDKDRGEHQFQYTRPSFPDDMNGQIFVGYDLETLMEVYARPSMSACFTVTARVAEQLIYTYLQNGGCRSTPSSTAPSVSWTSGAESNGPSEREKRVRDTLCYQCGEVGHYAGECNNGPKCRNCDSKEHKSAECTKEKLPGNWKKRWLAAQGRTLDKNPKKQKTGAPDVRQLANNYNKLSQQVASLTKWKKSSLKKSGKNNKTKVPTAKKTEAPEMEVGKIYKMTASGVEELSFPSSRLLEVGEVRVARTVEDRVTPHRYLGIKKSAVYDLSLCAINNYECKAKCEASTDNGADFTCITLKAGADLVAKGMKLHPVTPNVINQVSSQTKVDGVMYVNMIIHVPGEGRVKVHNEQVVVLDTKSALLGRGLLERMGLNIDDQMKRLARQSNQIITGNAVGVSKLQEDPEARLLELSVRRVQYVPNVSRTIPSTSIYVPSIKAIYTEKPRIRQCDQVETALSKKQVEELHEHIDADILEPFFKVVTAVEGDTAYRDEVVERAVHQVDKYEDSIRHEAVAEAPAKIPPYKPTLREGAQPVKCNPPRYTPKERLAAKLMVDKHIRTGHWSVVFFSTWASPLMMVPKPGSDPPFRPTVNSKNMNAMLQPIQWPFPDLRIQFGYIKRNRSWLFGIADVKGGFFQIEIDKDYRHIFSVMTDSVVLEPSRLIQGAVDSAKYFQAQLAMILGDDIPTKFIQWLDDFVNHANCWEQLLDNWEVFFAKCEEYNIKLAVDKIILASLQVNFCGHLIDGAGYTFEPSQYETLVGMSSPSNAKELQQFVSCTNWMRGGIPQYARRVEPLRQILEKVYAMKGNRTRYGLKGYTLERMGWGVSHQKAFDDVLGALKKRIKLYIPSEEDTVCVFTDASENGWGGVVTAVPNFDGTLSAEEQVTQLEHFPIGFVSGMFKDSAIRWNIQCKESFALKETMSKFAHITRCFKVMVYTDSKNVSHIYQPMREWPCSELHKPTEMRLRRWAEELDCFEYQLQHIAGEVMEQHCWADIISRWANPEAKILTIASASTKKRGRPKGSKTTRKHPVKKRSMTALEQEDWTEVMSEIKLDSFHNHGYSTILDAFSWPTIADIKASQDKYSPSSRNEVILDAELPLYVMAEGDKKGKVWIPMDEKELRVSLCILAHCSVSGHRGVNQSLSNLDRYHWTTLKEDVVVFVHSCLQCNQVKGGGGAVIPRPFGRSFTGTRPNEVISFDYLYMGKPSIDSPHKYEYMLVIKDTYSRFVTLTPCERATAYEAARCFLSDRGTHFKNQMIKELARVMGVEEHHFTHAYCPWANGSVERVNDVILKIAATLIAEQGRPFWHWPYYIDGLMDVINSYRSRVLKNLCPRQVMIGQPATKAVEMILVTTPLDKVGTCIPIVERKYEEQFQELQASLNDFYEMVNFAQLKEQV